MTDNSHTVDARGRLCPQPVLMTLNAIDRAETGTLTVLVDAEVSRENVIRAVASRGWKVTELLFDDPDYRILITNDQP